MNTIERGYWVLPKIVLNISLKIKQTKDKRWFDSQKKGSFKSVFLNLKEDDDINKCFYPEQCFVLICKILL